MAYSRSSRFLILFCVYLTVVVAAVVTEKEDCEGKICIGPLAYYADLNCTPIYGEGDSCCAVKYNCDHLKNRSRNKCYVNGHEYEIGEVLREEDRIPCDGHCTCQDNRIDGMRATFVCVQDFQCSIPLHQNDTCYSVRSPLECCAREIVCVDKEEDKPKCIVDGITYDAGDVFTRLDRPNTFCICLPGYEDQINASLCASSNRRYGSDLDTVNHFYINCPPLALNGFETSWTCDFIPFKYNETDISNELTKGDKVCLFKDVIMDLDEVLYLPTHTLPTFCIKCVCHVPPVPTCLLKNTVECNI